MIMAKREDIENKEVHRPSFHSETSSDSGLSSAKSALLADDPLYSSEGGRTKGMEEGEGDEGTVEEGRYRDLEEGDESPFLHSQKTEISTGSRPRRALFCWIFGLACVGVWLVAFVVFLVQKPSASALNDSNLAAENGNNSSRYGKPVTLDQILGGSWAARTHKVDWVPGPNGEDGLLIEVGLSDKKKGYVRIEDIRHQKAGDNSVSKILMEQSKTQFSGRTISPSDVWASKDLKSLLLVSDVKRNWRHSSVGKYWIFDVETQSPQPLDPADPDGLIQLAHWSPKSDAVVFVRDNNLYLRKLSSKQVITITKDGGKDVFYGAPDWVYEVEVFSGDSVTWWSDDGKYIAYLRTNESNVPEYPVQYFFSRPSGEKPPSGLENYPEVRQIKYPKAGAPNPISDLQFYDIEKNQAFSIQLAHDFDDDDRLIIEVVWASEGKVLVRETNRESDILKVFLIDAKLRTGKLVRQENIAELDGGWVEPSQSTRYIPADPANGRPSDGYVDTIVHEGYEHLGFFTPLNNPKPVVLTSGEWEVVNAPSAVDVQRGLVYFVATKQGPTERHIYQVRLDGSELRPLTNTTTGYYRASFSDGAGYSLLSYDGPSVPWQAVVNTHGDAFEVEYFIEKNQEVSQMTQEYALPSKIYQTVTVDGYTLQVVERRPPSFNPVKKYPVLFYLYGGPGSQQVDRRFSVDYQAYVASNLGYIVVTVDGRGTGFIGRKARCIIKSNLGYYEARDQIETAKIWAKKDYVDETRLSIWGWSYGGFMTLKTLEQDAGETFQYGMAVAPVTDWNYYG